MGTAHMLVTLDCSVLVAVQSHSIIFQQTHYSRAATTGPVAIKMIDDSWKNVSVNYRGEANDDCHHPLIREAAVLRHVGPHVSIPSLVDCVWVMSLPTTFSDNNNNNTHSCNPLLSLYHGKAKLQAKVAELPLEGERMLLPCTATSGSASGGGVVFPALVLPYIKGVSIQKLLHAYAPLPLSVSLHVVFNVMRVLEHIHGRGIVHGDVCIANVMVDMTGHVWLIDFMNAATTIPLDSSSHIRHASYVGIASGMREHTQPPELLLQREGGATAAAAAAAAARYMMIDVWALGVLIVELLSREQFLTTQDLQEKVMPLVHSSDAECHSFFQKHIDNKLRTIKAKRHGDKSLMLHSPTVWPLFDSWIRAVLACKPEDRLGWHHGSDGISWTAIRTHPFWTTAVSAAFPHILKQKEDGDGAAWCWTEDLEEEVADLTAGM